jgi:hypothetical protein
MYPAADLGDTAGVKWAGSETVGVSMVLTVVYNGLRGGGRRSSGACDLGILTAFRPLREVPCGDVDRVVLAGDHGSVKDTLGDGERGELTEDQGLVKAICGDGEDSSYWSSGPVSVEDSLVLSVSLYGFGRIFRSCGRTFGV